MARSVGSLLDKSRGPPQEASPDHVQQALVVKRKPIRQFGDQIPLSRLSGLDDHYRYLSHALPAPNAIAHLLASVWRIDTRK